MSEMTDERAAEVLAAHNGWRRYNGETGVPGAPEMGDPAELGHAIDHAVSRLRSQPPAEAPPSAPVGVEAVLRDALQGLIDFIEIDNPPMDADAMFIAKRALAQQPAAVDDAMVERAAKELRDLHREFGDGADLPEKIALEIAEAVLAAALAAQQGGRSDD